MEYTGIIRKVDELGRIVLPMELRRTLFINSNDPMEIFTDGKLILLRKYEHADIFTGETQDLIEYKGKKISRKTILDLCKHIGLDIASGSENTP